jgi:proteasome lid subunit RPN8/RPN11
MHVHGRPEGLARRAAEARGDEIVGVWHSHTHTDAYPSPTDVRQAADPAWVYVIVSLRDEAPVLRAYRIRDGEIAEVPVARRRGEES